MMASRAAAAALRTAALQGYRRWASSAAHAAVGGAAARVKARLVGDYVPVYVSLGMIALAATMGLHTARHQLANAPNVHLDKRKRETVTEVEDPDLVLHDADRFLTGSVFRKVAHVQDDSLAAAVADHHPGRKAVTLKDVGVDPTGIPGRGRPWEGVLHRIFNKTTA